MPQENLLLKDALVPFAKTSAISNIKNKTKKKLCCE